MSETETPRSKCNYAAEQIKQARAKRGKMDPAKVEAHKRNREIQNAILTAIADRAMTVPEIAEVTGMDTQLVFWWITAMRKYGKVQDDEKRGDYLAYRKK